MNARANWKRVAWTGACRGYSLNVTIFYDGTIRWSTTKNCQGLTGFAGTAEEAKVQAERAAHELAGQEEAK